MKIHSILGALATSAALTALGAQAGAQQLQVTGQIDPTTVRHLVMDASTGEIQETDNPVTTRSLCFVNNSFMGNFATIAAGDEWIDWASTATGTGNKQCNGTRVIQSITIGYATFALDPDMGGPGASLDVAVYRNTDGLGHLGIENTRQVLTGLAGSADGVTPAGFSLTILFTAGDFCIKDGDIGWGYVGVDGLTGPLLVDVPSAGSGVIDMIDIYSPGPATDGNFAVSTNFMTPDIASFWMEIDEGLGTDSTATLNNGTGVNPNVFQSNGAPVLVQGWPASFDLSGHPTAVATVIAVAGNAGLFNLSLGQLLLTPPILKPLDIQPAGTPHLLLLPKDVSLLGLTFHAQGALFIPGGGTLLTNSFQLDLLAGP